RRPWAPVDTRRTALWRDAAHVPAAADRPGRTGGAGVVVGSAASDAEPFQPVAGEPHRLAVVRRLAGGLRRGRRPGGRSALADADTRKHDVRAARRHRSARNDVIRTGDTTVKSPRSLVASTILAAALLASCGVPPGQPQAGSMTPAPSEVVDFGALYADNC